MEASFHYEYLSNNLTISEVVSCDNINPFFNSWGSFGLQDKEELLWHRRMEKTLTSWEWAVLLWNDCYWEDSQWDW